MSPVCVPCFLHESNEKVPIIKCGQNIFLGTDYAVSDRMNSCVCSFSKVESFFIEPSRLHGAHHSVCPPFIFPFIYEIISSREFFLLVGLVLKVREEGKSQIKVDFSLKFSSGSDCLSPETSTVKRIQFKLSSKHFYEAHWSLLTWRCYTF